MGIYRGVVVRIERGLGGKGENRVGKWGEGEGNEDMYDGGGERRMLNGKVGGGERE